MPKLKTLRDASVEDVEARLAELKNDFIEMSEGRRSDIDDAALADMIREVDSLDTWLTMSAAYEERQKRKVAATAGSIAGGGIRSYGDALVTEDFIRAVGRETGSGFGKISVPDNRGGYRNASAVHIGEFSWGDEVSKQVSNWLRVAGIYSASDAGVRAITEWGSGGPPGFDTTDSGGLLPRLGQPIPPVPRMAKLYLRDLMPSITTTLPTMPYVRELNPTTLESATGGGASTVAEGSTKPSAQLSFVSENAPISTVATTLTLSKQMFEDAPAVIQYINQRLPYLVKFREDQEFLSGSGTWPDLTGILNTPGLGSTPAEGSGAPFYAISIGNSFAALENEDGVPTAVVMNPTDAWTMFTNRAAGGSGTFDAGTPFNALPLTVWGVPSYRSRAYPQGTALAADFDRGAMVVDREQVNTQVYRERYAEQNLILLITEERVGLMVFRPDLFNQVTL